MRSHAPHRRLSHAKARRTSTAMVFCGRFCVFHIPRMYVSKMNYDICCNSFSSISLPFQPLTSIPTTGVMAQRQARALQPGRDNNEHGSSNWQRRRRQKMQQQQQLAMTTTTNAATAAAGNDDDDKCSVSS